MPTSTTLPMRWIRAIISQERSRAVAMRIVEQTLEDRPDLVNTWGRVYRKEEAIHVENVCPVEDCRRHREYCGAAHCESCDTYTHEGTCDRCENCDSCCECVMCDQCEERVGTVCSDCRSCEDCCEGCVSVRFVQNELKFHAGVATVENPSLRFVAAEIEVDGLESNSAAVDRVVSKWSASVVEDGSLGSGGFEINTAPASGDKFLEQIHQFGKALKDGTPKITNSCGLHVHIDARDFTFNDIRHLIRIYAHVEDALFAMQPERRRSSSYAKRCGKAYEGALDGGHGSTEESRLDYHLYGTTDEDSLRYDKGDKYGRARYSALNLHSWFYRRTVECRLHSGSANPRKIASWGVLWALILDAAKVGYVIDKAKSAYEVLLDIASRSPLALSYVKDRTAEFNGTTQSEAA